MDQPPFVYLLNEDEKQCWITAYAANADNEAPPEEVSRWAARIADDAVRELRKRMSGGGDLPCG